MVFSGWFQRLLGINTAQGVTGLRSYGIGNIGDDVFNTGTPEGQWQAYIYNSVIRAIVDRRSEAFTNGKWYNVVNEKESTSKEAKLFYELLNAPNGLQSSTEFKQDIFKALDIFGIAYVLRIHLPGFAKPQGYVVLPNHLMTIVHKSTAYPSQISVSNNIESIRLTYTDGQYSYNQNLDADIPNIMVIRTMSTPGVNPSKLVGLQDQINKLYIANNASNDILKHHGALMMITDDSKEGGAIPLPQDEKGFEKWKHDQDYGLTFGKSKYWYANKSLKATPLSLPIKDLMLNETTKDSTRQICDVLGYPINLFGFDETAKLSSTGGETDQAKKLLYQDMIIPQAQLIADTFSKAAFDMREQVTIDYTHIEQLQQSQKDLADKNKVLVDIYVTAVAGGLMTTEQAIAEMIFNGIITQNNTKP